MAVRNNHERSETELVLTSVAMTQLCWKGKPTAQAPTLEVLRVLSTAQGPASVSCSSTLYIGAVTLVGVGQVEPSVYTPDRTHWCG
jgi:hypothetical protein